MSATATGLGPAPAPWLLRLANRLPSPVTVGVAGTILIALSSFGAGAVRARGGMLRHAGLDFLSYGHGAGLCVAGLWLGVGLLVLAWATMGVEVFSGAYPRPHYVDNEPSPDALVGRVQRALWAWVIPLLFTAPLMSRDVYSYLMQGAMFRDGFDPYSQGAAVNPGPMLLEVSHDWRNTTTPYGPLHLWLGEGITRIVGDNITAGVMFYKAVSVLGFAALAWAIPVIARHLGGNPALALWLGVANPVMVLHLVGGMHNESIMVGLVSVGLVCALRHRFGLAVSLIAVAVSLKATAAIALPFVVWMAANAWAENKPAPTLWRRLWTFVCAGASISILATGVVALVTWVSRSSWGWLAEISGNSKIINPLALPSLLARTATDFLLLFDPTLTFNVPLGYLRTASMGLMLIGLVLVWWVFRKDDRAAIRGIALAYAVAFVFNSVTLPWYYASLISLVAVTRIPRALAQWAAGLSIVIALAFAGSGNHQLYNVTWMIGAALIAWFATALTSVDSVGGRAARESQAATLAEG